MSTGARTVLISRWRTAGQTSYALVREFAQELPHTSAADAWQRAVQLAGDNPLEGDAEPRVRKSSSSGETVKADHPFFWAAYLLVDSGRLGENQEPPPPPMLNAAKKDVGPAAHGRRQRSGQGSGPGRQSAAGCRHGTARRRTTARTGSATGRPAPLPTAARCRAWVRPIPTIRPAARASPRRAKRSKTRPKPRPRRGRRTSTPTIRNNRQLCSANPLPLVGATSRAAAHFGHSACGSKLITCTSGSEALAAASRVCPTPCDRYSSPARSSPGRLCRSRPGPWPPAPRSAV